MPIIEEKERHTVRNRSIEAGPTSCVFQFPATSKESQKANLRRASARIRKLFVSGASHEPSGRIALSSTRFPVRWENRGGLSLPSERMAVPEFSRCVWVPIGASASSVMLESLLFAVACVETSHTGYNVSVLRHTRTQGDVLCGPSLQAAGSPQDLVLRIL
jgi:hypothetical protein